MRYRGAVNYYVNLPANPTPGDVWVVRYQGSSGTIPNGHAYCWEEAAVSSEKTYIGDIPAYRGLINAQPDLVTWLTEIERKGLAWGAVTVHNGQIFFTPSSTDRPNLPNNYGQFLYPIGYTEDNRYLCLRKSDNCSGTASEQNIETYGFNYRHYYVSGSNFVLIEIPNPSHHSRITRRSISEDKYVNGQQYKAFNFERTNNPTGLSLPVQRSGSAYIYTPSYGGTYCDFASQYQNMQVANLVSNKLLFDSDGNIVQPGDGTYQYAYAGAETELQWVDLGNLAENLPTDKGCIYYNGICYSAGGYNMDKYMLRQDPTGEGNFYFNTSLSEITHGNITNSERFSNNIIGLNNSTYTASIKTGNSDSDQNEFRGNLILLSAYTRDSFYTATTGYSVGNIIVGSGIQITPNASAFCYNAIFGDRHTVSIGNWSGYNLVSGFDNILAVSGSLEYNVVLGESNRLSGNASYNNILIGYDNGAVTSSTSLEVTAIGKHNSISCNGFDGLIILGNYSTLGGLSNDNAAIGDYNTITGDYGYFNYIYGYRNQITSNGSSSPNYNITLGTYNVNTNSNYCFIGGHWNQLINSTTTGSYTNIIGYYNITNETRYSTVIGYQNSSTNLNETYIIGYYNSITGSENKYSILLGVQGTFVNTNAVNAIGYFNKTRNSSYCNLLGYSNDINYSYGTSYDSSECSLIGWGNSVRGSSHYLGVLGDTNIINGNNYQTSILGFGNKFITTSYHDNNILVGNFNELTDTNSAYAFGEHIIIENTDRAIRLGFYPLNNNDFFAIGNGTKVVDPETFEETITRSSIIRIDSSNQIYLNSTVPTPPIPTSNGTYSLSVSNGASSWVSGGGGSSSLAGLTDVSLTTPSNGQILVYDSANSVWVNANNSGGSNVPDKPISDGNYKLTIESGTAAWTIISGGGSINLPDAPLVDGIYQLDVTSGSPSWTTYTAPDAVIANPTGTVTDTLSTLQIGSTIYEILGGSDLPSAPQVDGTYSLDVDNGTLSWVLAQSSDVPTLPVNEGKYVLTATSTSIERTTESGDNRVTENGDARVGETGGSDITYSWEEAEESTEVIANPAGQATDTLNKLQVGSTIYDVPSGGGSTTLAGLSDVALASVANGDVLTYDSTLNKWKNDAGGGGGGTTVVANPSGQATETLNKLQVGATIYDVPSGGGSSGHAWSTTEHIVGTWIDGATVYEKTVDFGQNVIINSNTWYTTTISPAGIRAILQAYGTNGDGTFFGFLGMSRDGTYCNLLQTRNAAITIRYLTFIYLKSS